MTGCWVIPLLLLVLLYSYCYCSNNSTKDQLVTSHFEFSSHSLCVHLGGEDIPCCYYVQKADQFTSWPMYPFQHMQLWRGGFCCLPSRHWCEHTGRVSSGLRSLSTKGQLTVTSLCIHLKTDIMRVAEDRK